VSWERNGPWLLAPRFSGPPSPAPTCTPTRLIASGATWMSGSRWHDTAVLRVSVSNWSTAAADVAETVAAVRAAAR